MLQPGLLCGLLLTAQVLALGFGMLAVQNWSQHLCWQLGCVQAICACSWLLLICGVVALTASRKHWTQRLDSAFPR